MAYEQTPSQTVGPYFAYGLTPKQYGYPLPDVAGPVMCGEQTHGERIWLSGRVFDGEGNAVNDAMIEIWQANADGRYRHPADPRGGNVRDPDFTGFGRCGTGTDSTSRFLFKTIKPAAPEDGMAPHLNVIVFMRGLLTHVYTRVYFRDEAEANADDPVLKGVPDDRRETLIARREETEEGPVYHFDIHMQGTQETVFFDV